MRGPFTSVRAAYGLFVLLLLILTSPLLLQVCGPPSRREAWSGVSTGAGPIGAVIHTIYDEPESADILLVGTSPLISAVRLDILQQKVDIGLGRHPRIRLLGLFWPGQDLQYVLLRDYLRTHRPTMIVFDLPNSRGISEEPHTQMNRWWRFGEYSDALEGLPAISRVQIYGEFVLGAPMQLFTKLRPNLLETKELSEEALYKNEFNSHAEGFQGSDFVEDSVGPGAHNAMDVLTLGSPGVTNSGRKLGAYSAHFLKAAVQYAEKSHAHVVFMQLPGEEDYGKNMIAMVADWGTIFGNQYPLIGLPSKEIFGEISRRRMDHFYSDPVHFNTNGTTLITSILAPALERAYLSQKTTEPGQGGKGVN